MNVTSVVPDNDQSNVTYFLCSHIGYLLTRTMSAGLRSMTPALAFGLNRKRPSGMIPLGRSRFHHGSD